MNAQAAARLDAITNPENGLLWTRLNTGPDGRNLVHRFRHNDDPGNRNGWVFAIAEKAPPGQQWQDGSKWKIHGGLTRKQAEILEATSQSDDELVQRMIDLIIHKKDTTIAHAVAGQSPQLTPEQIQGMILEQATLLAKQMVENAKIQQGLVKPKLGPHRPRHQIVQKKAERIALWRERAALVPAMGEIRLRPRDGNIHGLWLRKAERLWETYVAQNPQVPTAEIPAPLPPSQ